MNPKERAGAPASTSQSPDQTTFYKGADSTIQLLLAEDNPADVELVRFVLDHHELTATLTIHADGERMLAYIGCIDAHQVPCPDIVLLDLNLPKVNGHTLLRRLRESPVCGHVPVIIFSSSNASTDREKATRLGATGYFCKPNNFDDFMRLGDLICGNLR